MQSKTINIIRNVLLELRNKYAETIESLPINQERQQRSVKGIIHRMPIKSELQADMDMVSIRAAFISTGKEAFNMFFEQVKNDIIIDLKGHYGITKGKYTDLPANVIRINQTRFESQIAGKFARGVYNLSKNILALSDEELYLFLELGCDIIDLDDPCLVLISDTSYKCHNCAEHVKVALDLNDLTIKPFKMLTDFILKENKSIFKKPAPCEFPNGIGEHSITLSIPSGKVVLANNLHSIIPKETDRYESTDFKSQKVKNAFPNVIANTFPTNDQDTPIMKNTSDVCYSIGRKQNAEYYAQFGLLFFQGRNSSTDIFKNKNTITVKNEYLYNVDTDKETKNYTKKEKNVGHISMSLWAIHGMDYDLFVEYCKLKELDPKEVIQDTEASIVNVDSGEYLATSYFETDRQDNESLLLCYEKNLIK